MLMENFFSSSSLTAELNAIATQVAVHGKIPIEHFCLKNGSVTDEFGADRPGGKSHEGVDYKVGFADAIIAPVDGFIKRRYYDSPYGGFSIVFQPKDYSFELRIRHLCQFNPHRENAALNRMIKGSLDEHVKEAVSSGKVIGYAGLTGRATAQEGHAIIHIAAYTTSGSKFNPVRVIAYHV